MYGGRKVVCGSAEGWTPPGPKLIGEQAPEGGRRGKNITNTYFLLPHSEKDRVNQVQDVEADM